MSNINSKSDYIIGLKNTISDTELRKKIKDTFKVGKTRANEIFHQLFDEIKTNDPIPNNKPASFQHNNDAGVLESVGEDAKTLEELLEICKVDLNEWRVEKYLVNKWATARKNKTVNLTYNDGSATGSVDDKGGMTVHPIFQIKAWLVRKKEVKDYRLMLDKFIADAANFAPTNFILETIPTENNKLLEISIPDLHLSKLCWGKETMYSDYDIKIAPRLYREAINDFISKIKGFGVSKILLPIGNDFYNSDNAAGTTTAGTPQSQSEDSRWPKTFTVGCELLSGVIEQLAQYFQVEVKVISGNHDYERTYYLGEYIKAWFRNNPHVVVDNAPTQRKYFRFGKTLLGFTHGNEEKHDKLPLIMASDRKEDWAITDHREFHVGHLHNETTKEYNGVKVRILPSLMPPDQWHASKGYVGNIRAAEAFLYDENDGLIAVFYHNVKNN